MSELLIDTDILIDIGNNDATAKRRIIQENQNQLLVVSTVTVMELTVGCRNKSEFQALNRFLKQFRVITINEEVSKQALKLIQDYALSHGLRIPDALIAATAISYNLPLLSKNQRDYRFISQLNLLAYP